MRYLTAISLAVVVLMALACTATPAEPTPNIDATVEARAKELVAEQVNNLPPNPDLAADYFDRGVGYARAGDWQLAIGDFTKAINLGLSTNDSGSNLLTIAYFNRGLSYNNLGLGFAQTAIDDYTKAIQLDPEHSNAYLNPGNSYSELDRYQTAINDYTKAIQLNPDHAVAYLNRGITYRKLGRANAATIDKAKACHFDSQYCDKE